MRELFTIWKKRDNRIKGGFKPSFSVTGTGDTNEVRMMARGDVSFTFLDRIQEIEFNIADSRWQSALALALTLPDICGGIAFPELVRKYRDGRIVRERNGEPSRDIGKQYKKWIDTFAADYLKKNPSDLEPYISGERCWQLRCEYLHQNKGFDNEEGEPEIQFHLGINCGSSVCRLEEETPADGTSIRIDIQEFCLRLCKAAKAYYHQYKDTVDFALYNTPVIDFIKWSETAVSRQQSVWIIAENKTFGQGLEKALAPLQCRTELLLSSSEAVKKLKRKMPDLCIIEESVWDQADSRIGTAMIKNAVLLCGSVRKSENYPDTWQLVSRFTPVKELRRIVRTELSKVV